MSSPSRHAVSNHPAPHLRGRAHPGTIMLRLGTLFTLALVAAPARADSPFEGRYQGRGEGRLSLQVFDLDDGSGTHFIVADTAIPNECTGELRGLAKPAGARALVLTRKPSGSDEACTLTLRFDADRKRARMEEQGCGDFHGTSCAFGGALTRR